MSDLTVNDGSFGSWGQCMDRWSSTVIGGMNISVNHKLWKTKVKIGVSAIVNQSANTIGNRAMSTTGYAYA
jgi:hypothetical protein